MNSLRFQTENKELNSATLWDQRFVLLNLSFFLIFMNIAFLYLYPLALDDMGSEHHVIGLVMGAFSVAAVISRPFFGKLIVLRGEYWVFSVGTVTSFLASLGYILITAFGPAMLLIRVFHGIGFSAAVSAGFSLAAKTVHPRRRGEAFSIIGASLMFAVALAPSFGEVLIRKWGFSALYLAASGSVLLAWFAVIKSNYQLPIFPQGEKTIDVNYFSLLKNRSFLFLLISTIIFAHCQATVTNFLVLIANEKGIAGGRFFLASSSMAILILLTTGKLLDRFGKLFFMRFSYPIFSLGILLIPGMIGDAFYLVPAILYGVGIGILFSSHNALAASHGSRIEKPAIMSIFTAIYDTGFVTGTIISGWFAHQASLEVLYWACGVLGFIGLFMVVLLPIEEG